jgi:hypothetical protein
MMVGIDETRHHDAPGRVDYRPVHLQIFSDGDDLPAFDQNIALGKVAHSRVHRHDGAAANDVAPSALTNPDGWTRIATRRRDRRARSEKFDPAAATAPAVDAFKKSRREPLNGA